MNFYSSSRVAVSIILTVTILLSSIGFSYISYEKQNINSLPGDYLLENLNGSMWDDVANIVSGGATETDKQEIASLPYIKSVDGEKIVKAVIASDEITDFMRIENSNFYLNTYYSEQGGDNITSIEMFKSVLTSTTLDDEYYKRFRQVGIEKEGLITHMYGYDDSRISNLENLLVEGKIDYDKLNSGDEVILVAPQKAEYSYYMHGHTRGENTNYDENVGINKVGYESVLTADCQYKVGDTIEVSVATTSYADENGNLADCKYVKKSVKIGAIVSPNDVANKNGFYIYDFSIITNNKGISNFIENCNYSSLHINAVDGITDDIDTQIMDSLNVYSKKYDGFLESNYQYNQQQKQNLQQMLTALLAIIIIAFVICASIINTSISSQIRENKKSIGTLRALGADESDLVKTYICQMLSMFSWGYGFGFGLFTMFFVLGKIGTHIISYSFVFQFNPWLTIIMAVVLFVVCAINLWSRIRKEMKNSIVENIREL